MSQIREISAEEFGTDDSSATAAEVRRVTGACDDSDHVSTLNEQACLQLRHRGLRDARLWVALAEAGAPEERVVGFALLYGDILDLAVDPDHRGQGVGTQLAHAVLGASTNSIAGRVEAWSHSDHPAAARLAERFGLPRARELVIMSRPTSIPLPPLSVPDGVVVRTYQDSDLDALLEVNAHAFAHHPEQGGMSAEDFHERAREAWFDPEGLFVATSGDRLIGFHWTKVHRDEEPPYGEVYVVAVSPKAAGKGLGKVLTNIGLAHLADTGVDEVILYVDGDNEPAIAVYSGLGFRVARTEAQYRGTPRLT